MSEKSGLLQWEGGVGNYASISILHLALEDPGAFIRTGPCNSLSLEIASKHSDKAVVVDFCSLR